MKVEIKIKRYFHEVSSIELYIAQIFVSGSWFKEIGSFATIQDLLQTVSENEDFLQEIKRLEEYL